MTLDTNHLQANQTNYNKIELDILKRQSLLLKVNHYKCKLLSSPTSESFNPR